MAEGESGTFLLESTFRFAAIFKAIESVLCTAVWDAPSNTKKKKNNKIKCCKCILTHYEIFVLQKKLSLHYLKWTT